MHRSLHRLGLATEFRAQLDRTHVWWSACVETAQLCKTHAWARNRNEQLGLADMTQVRSWTEDSRDWRELALVPDNSPLERLGSAGEVRLLQQRTHRTGRELDETRS